MPLHLDLRGETLNYHIVAMGSSSEPSYLGNPITSIDKLLGHVYFMGKVFKIFKSQPYSACHVLDLNRKNAETQTAYVQFSLL